VFELPKDEPAEEELKYARKVDTGKKEEPVSMSLDDIIRE
jgi:hypothetical protein